MVFCFSSTVLPPKGTEVSGGLDDEVDGGLASPWTPEICRKRGTQLYGHSETHVSSQIISLTSCLYQTVTNVMLDHELKDRVALVENFSRILPEKSIHPPSLLHCEKL